MPAVTIDRELVIFADQQNQLLFSKALNNIRYMNVLGLLVVVLAIFFAIKSTEVRIAMPLFSGKYATFFAQPNINPSVSLEESAHVAQKWSERLLSLHFRRMNYQLNQIKPLFFEDGFSENYYDPLKNNDAGKDVISGEPINIFQLYSQKMIITTAVAKRPILNSKYKHRGRVFYDYSVPIIQTVQDASGEPKNIHRRIKMILIEVPRNVHISGLQIFSSAIGKGAMSQYE